MFTQFKPLMWHVVNSIATSSYHSVTAEPMCHTAKSSQPSQAPVGYHSSTVHYGLTSLSSGVFSSSPMPSCCITWRTNSCTNCLRSVTPLVLASSVRACTAAQSSFAVCQQNYTTKYDEYNT
jgi:hypothetical protein